MIKKLSTMLFITNLGFAATTGTLLLQGSIPTSTNITVTGVSPFNNLNLTTTQSDLLVANVQEQNNTALGYKVTIASANTGKLKNGSVGSINYTAKYNGTAFTLSTTPVTVTNVTSQTTVTNITKPLTISYTGVTPASMMAGTYSDTLTLAIAAN